MKKRKLIYVRRSINHGGEPEDDDEDPDRIIANRPRRDPFREMREELLIGAPPDDDNN